MAHKKSTLIGGSTTTAYCICDQHIDQTPRLYDPRHHCLDRLVVADIDLDPQGDATCGLDSATVLSAIMSFASDSNLLIAAR